MSESDTENAWKSFLAAANVAAASAQYDQAEELSQKAYDMAVAGCGAESAEAAECLIARAKALKARGREEEGHESLRRGLEILRKLHPDQPEQNWDVILIQ